MIGLSLRLRTLFPAYDINVVAIHDTLTVTGRQPWYGHRDEQVETTWAIGKIVDEYAPDVRRRIVVRPSWLARVCVVVRSAMRSNR